MNYRECWRIAKSKATPPSNPLTPLLLLHQFPVLSNQRPTIDASLGVGMVGGVKALYAVLLALVLGS